MDFALFYEIPMARPWTDTTAHEAIKNAVEEAVLGDKVGFHSFWLTEHHFLPELALSTAPDVILSHVAAVTKKIRVGHGVRLMPHPYNNPIRIAEQAAVLDHLTDGRFDFGTGRSATRAELEGFGIDPHKTRAMQDEALDFVVAAWTEEELEWDREFWKMPKRSVVPKPFTKPHPPIWQAATSPEGQVAVGEKGIGLLSFTIGVGPEVLAERIAGYKDGLTRAKPIGKVINDQAGAFTMVHCAPTMAEAKAVASESFIWYGSNNLALVTEMGNWIAGMDAPLGTYEYIKNLADAGAGEIGGGMSIDSLDDSGAIVIGDPDHCVEVAKRYKEAGCDLLMCLVNPYKIPHDKVMQSIELIGKYVIPELKD